MKHIFDSSSFVEISRDLDNACLWLKKVGINYSPTRIGRYKEIFTEMSQAQILDNLSSVSDSETFSLFANAAHETYELLRIYEGLSHLDDKNLFDRLKRALKGHELFSEDNSNTSGRDFCFELSIAAKFAKQNISIDFDHCADLKIPTDTGNLYIECKRIRSEQQVQKRVKHGLKQLKKRYQSDKRPKKSRGLLVISISKLINQDLKFLIGNNDQEIALKAQAYNKAFIEKYRNYWRSDQDYKTLGVVIVLDVPSIIKPINLLTTCHEITMTNIVSPQSPDYKIFKHIGETVFGQA